MKDGIKEDQRHLSSIVSQWYLSKMVDVRPRKTMPRGKMEREEEKVFSIRFTGIYPGDPKKKTLDVLTMSENY